MMLYSYDRWSWLDSQNLHYLSLISNAACFYSTRFLNKPSQKAHLSREDIPCILILEDTKFHENRYILLKKFTGNSTLGSSKILNILTDREIFKRKFTYIESTHFLVLPRTILSVLIYWSPIFSRKVVQYASDWVQDSNRWPLTEVRAPIGRPKFR